jgi:sensor histidine kinase YesM
MYFGADIYDKYKNKGDKYKPNAQRAFNQAVFQAFASIILPAVFGHVGMSAFSQMDKYKGAKVSTNAKEQTLRFIKAHASINDALAEGKDKTEALNEFVQDFDKYYRAKKVGYSHKNIFVKMYDKLLANCKRGAIANSNEERLKAFAKTQYTEILSNSTTTEMAKHTLDKKIFKQKAWKSAGAFTAILLTASLIDKFVEKVIIVKFVKPIQQQINYRRYAMNEFANAQDNNVAQEQQKA